MGRMPMQHLLQEFQPRQRHQAMQAFAKSKRSLKQARKENTAGSLERLYANSNDQRQSRQGMLKLYNLIDDWIDWRRICSIWALLQPPTFFQQLYLRKRYSFLEPTKRLRNSSCHRLHLSTETGNIIYNSLYD